MKDKGDKATNKTVDIFITIRCFSQWNQSI